MTTEKEFTEFMKISERENFLKNNPHIVQIFTAKPPQVDSTKLMGGMKLDATYQNHLNRLDKFYQRNAKIAGTSLRRMGSGNLSEV